MPPYPPYQQPLVDRATGLVTRPWQLFFLSLLPTTGDSLINAIPPGSLPIDRLEYLDSPRLLGRGSDGVGPVESITLGTGLAMSGTELRVTVDVADAGYWTPITNGDPLSPEILFDAEGDCVVGFVPTPE